MPKLIEPEIFFALSNMARIAPFSRPTDLMFKKFFMSILSSLHVNKFFYVHLTIFYISSIYDLILTVISNSTGILPGKTEVPRADLVCLPFSPNILTINSEAPFTTSGCR